MSSLPLVTKSGNTFWKQCLCYLSRFYHTAGHLNGPWLWSDMRKCLCRVGSRHQRLQRWDLLIGPKYTFRHWPQVKESTEKSLYRFSFSSFTHHIVWCLFRGSLSDPFHEWGPAADPGGPRALHAASSHPVLHWGKLHDLLWQGTVLSLQCQRQTAGTHGGGGQH